MAIRMSPREAEQLLAKVGQTLAPSKARYPGQPKSGMNKTESRFAESLQGKVLTGEVIAWKFEHVKLVLSLGKRCGLTVDFVVRTREGQLEFIDVKGPRIEEDSTIKIKWAAREYAAFGWKFFVEQEHKPGRGFVRTEF